MYDLNLVAIAVASKACANGRLSLDGLKRVIYYHTTRLGKNQPNLFGEVDSDVLHVITERRLEDAI